MISKKFWKKRNTFESKNKTVDNKIKEIQRFPLDFCRKLLIVSHAQNKIKKSVKDFLT